MYKTSGTGGEWRKSEEMSVGEVGEGGERTVMVFIVTALSSESVPAVLGGMI